MSAPSSGAADAVDPGHGLERRGTWTYRLLHEPHLTDEFDRQMAPAVHPLGSGSTAERQAYSVTTRPCPDPEQRGQDRHVVASRALDFRGHFEGHAGHDTVDYTLVALLSSVRYVLFLCIARLDASLTANPLSVFPAGEASIRNTSGAEVERVASDQGSAPRSQHATGRRAACP
ncbi:hypothetical protein DFH11DRAFT_1883299 [Phellopilus nigrolimitatus]|nr:hypothetical protein DFH11DRAFT_1883299 [Phellopilus nigrolimitatus]